MNSKWKEFIISEVCESIIDCVNKTAKTVHEPTEYKMIRTTNVKNGWIDVDNVRYVSKEVYDKWTRRIKPQKEDIILTREAPLGEVGLVRTDDKIFLGQRTILYRANTKMANAKFLYYTFLSEIVQGQFQSFGSGSTVEHIRIKDCETFKVYIPNIEIQKIIAKTLSTYDDLIEINNNRIRLLEDTVQQLYKEWFVRMRFPGYKRVKFEKGIPKTWKIESLKQHIVIMRGKSYTSEEIDDSFGDNAFINLKNMKRGGGFRLGGTKYFTGKFKKEQVVFPGDIVMAVTDMTQDRLIVGRVARVPLTEHREYVFSLDIVKLVPQSLQSDFLYSTLRFNYYGEHIAQFANGTNVLHLNPELLRKESIIIPDKDLIDRFVSISKPIYEQIDILAIQIEHLRQIRNRLLPRLISGKLELKIEKHKKESTCLINAS
ncbi:MAG: restriction modification system specificity domain protein [Bacteroidetes bacterium]|jgi:type I restriction enzyme S subunit|nr:restriction modification system specificity domain protein [Bacteroidota bacterium]